MARPRTYIVIGIQESTRFADLIRAPTTEAAETACLDERAGAIIAAVIRRRREGKDGSFSGRIDA